MTDSSPNTFLSQSEDGQQNPPTRSVGNDVASGEESLGHLSTWDVVSLIVGIVIGSTIFKTSGEIFASVSGPWWGLGLWVLCGGLSLAGALCYAELATTYPRLGGEYNYLTRAFGAWAGFLFGWAELVLIQTGNIGALSYVFAEYALRVFGPLLGPAALSERVASLTTVLAVGAVFSLTALNMVGLHAGKWTQNVLTAIKLLGMGLLIVVGLSVSGSASFAVTQPPKPHGWTVAFVLVLFAYGGWNDAGFVAAEVRNRSRNIPRSLLLGIGLITCLYVLLNVAYLGALGFEGLRASQQPAADALKLAIGEWAERAMSLLVMISALGSMNGLIFSASRLHSTVGQDHGMFAALATISETRQTPVCALVFQGSLATLMILGVGTDSGRAAVDWFLASLGQSPVSWSDYNGGFGTLVAASAPIFWLFFLGTAVAYFRLRIIDRDRPRPFTAPWFPLCPLVFLAMCGFGLYSATMYAAPLLPLISVPFLVGVPLYWMSRKP